MLKKITKWETEDGKVFDTQEEVEDYMFEQEKEVMTHTIEQERLYQKAERDLMVRSLDEWVMETGAVTHNSSWHSELGAIVEMAFNKGAEVEAQLQAARSAPALELPLGWKLVPTDATPEMLQKTIDSGYYHGDDEAAKAVIADEYRTLIAASPQSPAEASMISSREVVSNSGSGVKVTRLNLSEAGRAALQSKASHIPEVGCSVSNRETLAAQVQMLEAVAYQAEHQSGEWINRDAPTFQAQESIPAVSVACIPSSK